MFNIKRYSILKMLLDNAGEEVSGELMSQNLAISRAAIAKHIKKLRSMGCQIHARPGGGYTIVRIPNIICEDLIMAFSKSLLPTVVKETVESTNINAKEWAEHGAEHGSMIVAKVQTSGRGRLQRLWESVEGGIWSSVILKLNISPAQVQPVTLAAAVAVCKAIINNCPDAKPMIKWPNDVLINGKKVCGILTEFIGDIDELRYLIVGIGINNNFEDTVLDKELRDKATSLKSQNISINSSKLIAEVRNNLLDITSEWIEKGSTENILNYYRENMAYKDKKINISGAGQELTGIFKDIDTDGALILMTDKGEEKIISGEISVRRV